MNQESPNTRVLVAVKKRILGNWRIEFRNDWPAVDDKVFDYGIKYKRREKSGDLDQKVE